MSLNDLIAALERLRAEQPHLAEMEVYAEDGELGPEHGHSIVGVAHDNEGTTLRITNL